MLLDPQLVALLEKLGPPLLAIALAVLTMLGSAVGVLARLAWRAQQTKMGALSTSIADIAKSIAENRVKAHQEREQVAITMAGLRTDVDLAQQSTESLSEHISELSDAVKKQQCAMAQMLRDLGEVTGRLEGMFRSARHSTL